ncbi:tRNA lysidine(34) synthetase TilS [Rhizobium sp. G187]|uniref:tRNA lysidine(34) synthetase TilS n=1 Tax=Rhizobium sp. G187 TaxID=3451352 RepID=UPI003EE6E1DA
MSAAAAETATTGRPSSPEAALSAFLSSLKTPATLLVAISGGSDSTGLLILLKNLLRTSHRDHRLVAATVDHRLRQGSTEEARWVADLCKSLDIPHDILDWTGAKPKTGIPAAARDARYRLLSEAAERMGADAILTGHTLDDQIETVRMRAERAATSGLGLAGMAPATLYGRRHWILRPLLGVRREAIRVALRQQAAEWLDDPTNEDPRYERVRVRRDALPFDETIIASAAASRRALCRATADWLQETVERLGDYVFRIGLPSPPAAGIADDPARRHALSTLAAIAGGRSHRPQADSMDRLMTALDAGQDFRLTLAGALFVRRRNDLFCLRERRGLLPLPLPAGTSVLWDGRYKLDNLGAVDLHIAAGNAPINDPSLPGTVKAALAGTHPFFHDFQGNPLAEPGQVRSNLHIALLDHMLPDFDLPLARAIDRLVGRDETPFCPI